jgi:transposase-like protein
MPQTATIKTLPVAFAMLKTMQAEGVEWGEDYRCAAGQALAKLLEGRMAETIDRHLAHMAELGAADRRNGAYPRWLLTELGLIELHVPRTRTFSALKVVRAYAKAVACLRADLDDLLACFRYPTLAARRAVRTTNAIERRFREVRRRTRPMGTFQDRTSMDRILFAVFIHENRNQALATPFPLTQTF